MVESAARAAVRRERAIDDVRTRRHVTLFRSPVSRAFLKRFERPNGTPRRREMVRAVDAIAEDAGKKATRVVASKGEYDAIDRAAKHLARTENWMDAYMHFTLCVNDRTAHAEEFVLA